MTRPLFLPLRFAFSMRSKIIPYYDASHLVSNMFMAKCDKKNVTLPFENK